MEHLSPKSRQMVIKMSEARLRQKLVQAGYHEVDVAKFDRATLLEYYAKILLTETAYVPAKEEQEEGEEAGDSDGEEKAEFAESNAGVQNTASGDKSADEKRRVREERQWALEERRLEERRLQREEQRLQREQQRELEEKRLEVQRMQLEQQRIQLEQQRILEEKRCELQYEEQRRQREFQEMKSKEDRA